MKFTLKERQAMMQKLIAAGIVAFSTLGPGRAAQLKQMPIDFVGEWCNGTTSEGETNWQLPSWLDEADPKCGNILSVSKYEFSMTIDKTSYTCLPDAIRTNQDTAPSGTAYFATIVARCVTGGQGRLGQPITFQFHRYKGNIYIKKK